MSRKQIYNIAPFEYLHVRDNNSNKTRLVQGPDNFSLELHEEIVSNVNEKMLIIPNNYYVEIRNPVERDEHNKIVLDKFNIPKNRWEIIEVRTRWDWPTPFPLYPNEELVTGYTKTKYVNADQAVHYRVELPVEFRGVKYVPGDEFLVKGPCHLSPRQELTIVREIEHVVIEKGTALMLMALRNTVDSNDVPRKAGEIWLMYDEGSYLPRVHEEILEIVKAEIIDENTALHLQALYDFVDVYSTKRRAGDEWIITKEISSSHICGIYEKKIAVEKRIVMTSDEYCVLINPYNHSTRTNELGKVKLLKGECSFFLNPGESIQGGKAQKVNILTENQAVLVQARENFEDENHALIRAGEKWMIRGPIRYIPPVEVTLLDTRSVIPLDSNEGIYIRNTKTGKVRIEMGNSYLLKPEEIPWEKELPSVIEAIYNRDLNISKRDKTRIVTYPCPFNSVMQIYNLKKKTNRIVFGPSFAILEPDEEFTLMTLSGKTPKVEGMVRTLFLKLGPIFSTDEFDVETVDHTRLKLKVSYNWRFDIKDTEHDKALKIFEVRDFIGDMCSTLASKIRSYLATITFEDFHKNSDNYIKKSVFGEIDGIIQRQVTNGETGLTISDVDTQCVIPTDPTTQSLLQKSVSLAIELATKTIEQEFNIQAKIKEQQFKGELQKLSISNEIEFLKKKNALSEYQVQSSIIEKTGLSKAQVEAYQEAVLIEADSVKDLAVKEKAAYEIEGAYEKDKIKMEYDNEYTLKKETQRLELMQILKNNEIEREKFKNIVESIGPETLVQIARAGPELQAKLLSGLNLSGYILTDGNNPINLFNVANTLVQDNN